MVAAMVAVTVEWVSLTAGILLLGVSVVYGVLNNGVSSLTSNINAALVAEIGRAHV